MVEPYRNLKVKPETYYRLAKHGVFGDTADILINKILDLAEGQKK